MHWEARFRELASRQAGAIGIDQLASIGCNGSHWGRAKRNGRWHAVSRRVLVMAGTAPTADQRAHAAVLDAGAGAMLHGASTLAVYGLRGYNLSTIHVDRRRGTTSEPCRLAKVHRLRDIRACDVRVVRGIPTISPLRAIWSEASRYSNDRWFEIGLKRIGRLLDDAHALKLVTWEDLHRSVEQLARRGRAGTRLMRALAAQRQPGSSPTESRNEDRLEAILERGNIPLPMRQRVVGGDHPVGRADHRDTELPVVIEVNSLIHHALPSDQAADEERYRQMNAAGFTVAVAWEDDLWSNPRSVLAVVRLAHRQARRGPPAVFHSASCPWPADPDRNVVEAHRPRSRG